MAFNKDNTVKIREKYNTKHLVAENAADMRRSELWIRIPELREIDRRLSATGPRLMAISLRKSNETVAEIRADVEELSRRRAEIIATDAAALRAITPSLRAMRDEGAVCVVGFADALKGCDGLEIIEL